MKIVGRMSQGIGDGKHSEHLFALLICQQAAIVQSGKRIDERNYWDLQRCGKW
jgi:hypothetical protein